MFNFKKIVLLTLLAATFMGTSAEVDAQGSFASVGGVGYEESLVLPSMTPYIALCTVAALGIVAIAVRHTGHGHSHSHNHSH